MKTENLKFPIFAFGRTDQENPIEENMIYVIPTIKVFTTVFLHGLKNNYFSNLEIVDCNGQIYRIKKANFVAFKGIEKYLLFLGNRREVIVHFEYQDKTERITLEDFKKRIIPMIENLKDFWEGGYYYNIEDLKTLLIHSKSFEKIAELLG